MFFYVVFFLSLFFLLLFLGPQLLHDFVDISQKLFFFLSCLGGCSFGPFFFSSPPDALRRTAQNFAPFQCSFFLVELWERFKAEFHTKSVFGLCWGHFVEIKWPTSSNHDQRRNRGPLRRERRQNAEKPPTSSATLVLRVSPSLLHPAHHLTSRVASILQTKEDSQPHLLSGASTARSTYHKKLLVADLQPPLQPRSPVQTLRPRNGAATPAIGDNTREGTRKREREKERRERKREKEKERERERKREREREKERSERKRERERARLRGNLRAVLFLFFLPPLAILNGFTMWHSQVPWEASWLLRN